MATYKVTDPTTGRTVKLTGDSPPTESELNEIFSSMPSTQQVKPSFMDTMGAIMQPYRNSQLGSPSQIAESIPPLLDKMAGKVGQETSEFLGRKQVNPYVSAGVGTAISMAPTVALSMINPMKGAPKVVPEMAIGPQRRALGMIASDLKTEFARGQASRAAKVSLEQGVTSATGNPTTIFRKANDLAAKTGQKLGAIRESVGPQPIEPILNAIDDYKAVRLKGASGGKWDTVLNKIEDAKDTIKGLVGGTKKQLSPITIKGETIPGFPGSPMKIIPGAKFQEPSVNMFTGKPESVSTNFGGVGDIIVGGEKAIPSSTSKIVLTRGESPSMLGGGVPSPKISLKRIADAKKEIADSVNWMADNVSQKDAKGLAMAIEKGTEKALAQAGGDIKQYKALKPIYSAAKTMKKGLNKELARQEGNMAVSLPALVAGASGGPLTALKIGGFELAKRRGAGIAASEIMSAANAPAKLGIPALQSANQAIESIKPEVTPKQNKEYLKKAKKQYPDLSDEEQRKKAIAMAIKDSKI